jgi:prevent-host-death family protein
MLRFTSRDLQRRIGEIQDLALTQPVWITRNGRDRLVVLSAEEYRRLKRRDRVALRVEELTDEELEAIGRAEVPAEFNHLDAELEEPGAREPAKRAAKPQRRRRAG